MKVPHQVQIENIHVVIFGQILRRSCAVVSQRSAWTGQASIGEDDPELKDLIDKEKHRQTHGLELIASEVNRNKICPGRENVLMELSTGNV